jgi:hypothetical protein
VQQQHAQWELGVVRTIRFGCHEFPAERAQKATAQTSEIQKSFFFSPISINGPFGNANNRDLVDHV